MSDSVLMGFAEVDVTPASNVQTIGFNRRDNLSRGVLHRLSAQITVWKSLVGVCCLVCIDNIGFNRTDADILRDMIGGQLGVGRDQVMLCFSHTHAAPNEGIERDYFHFLCGQVLHGVIEADKQKAPVKAAWGTVHADLGINRRDANGVLDKRIGVLKVVDAGTERLVLLILRVTAHANVLLRDNYLLSSDFVGVSRELLEAELGAKVIITQGASGNVKPRFSGSLGALDKMAHTIRNAVVPYIETLTPERIKRVSMLSQTETFFADVPTMERARAISDEAMRENRIDGSTWLTEVARLRGEGITRQSSDIEIQYFVLNDGCLCGVAEEIMCELAVEAARACDDDRLYLAGYTNGCGGYLPTAEEYDRGGYEVLHSYLLYYIYHGRVMPLNRGTAGELVRAVAGQWKAIRSQGSVPPNSRFTL